ncbi:hypothetical protein CARUB_v10004752mg [Capsella rubella]|uniref:Uncharacterized protein n=1 Tax=Capsella rubella TaxID=81985 RepID=R0F4E9_9BRAS|nr:myb-like protein X [Capsella rubella]XP_006283690.1 myb-like protein X [Capsella rubella]XP_006283691.1 myb-like protein X [Capsella rubella]EOA16586.1 hypothetical protein CARUB_v10004752mg [Capsella rubella]EOA16587.1 hypothetical protein CARUB_v10004752mg [Capsella rubella]EOA16588.1 hypothetical protein CARUB_v10004752mg [Capsella rubella]EOA16589.1 hypothetical protein CARUB_v10004752mg [Capsella rubella]
MKKASSRSQRGSKGIKGKHILQICVLLGVCIWLIYQVKYSHDKKKEFYEKDGEKSTVLLSEVDDGVVKLGRKDLLPGYHNQKEKHVEDDEDEEEISHGGEEKEETKSKVENGNHEEEEKEEEEEVVEEDEEDKNKQGEEVAEEDEDENKHEEDEIDEQDQSKTGGETDKDDETPEEEKESGTSESDEKEKETNHADEIDMTVDEAREEHYKADDASSAVSHESRILNTNKLKESSNETAQEINRNGAMSEVKIQIEPDLKLGEAENASFVNKITTEVKDGDNEPSSSEAKSVVTESQGDTVNGTSAEAILEASGFLQNETEIMRDRSQEDSAPPAGFSETQPVLELEQIRNEVDPNITVSANITNKDSIQDESRNSTSESVLIENISGSNTTEVKEDSRSEVDDESAEKERSHVFATELTEEADNTSGTSISQEEMDALTDPQTLPDIRIEGNEEDEEEAIGTE